MKPQDENYAVIWKLGNEGLEHTYATFSEFLEWLDRLPSGYKESL